MKHSTDQKLQPIGHGEFLRLVRLAESERKVFLGVLMPLVVLGQSLAVAAFAFFSGSPQIQVITAAVAGAACVALDLELARRYAGVLIVSEAGDGIELRGLRGGSQRFSLREVARVEVDAANRWFHLTLPVGRVVAAARLFRLRG